MTATNPEEFRPVPGFPLYRISNLGRIQSRLRYRILTGNWHDLSPIRNRDGYLMISLSRDGMKHRIFIHRLVLEAFAGPCPPRHECRHLDNDRTNNRFDNLAWGTKKQNQADRRRHGTVLEGEVNPRARLTADGVRGIRSLAESGLSHSRIARRFGVCKATVTLVVARKTWGHL